MFEMPKSLIRFWTFLILLIFRLSSLALSSSRSIAFPAWSLSSISDRVLKAPVISSNLRFTPPPCSFSTSFRVVGHLLAEEGMNGVTRLPFTPASRLIWVHCRPKRRSDSNLRMLECQPTCWDQSCTSWTSLAPV